MDFVHDNWSCCNILYIIYRIQFHSIPSVFLRSLMPSGKSQRGLNRQKSHAICGTLRLWSWHRRKGGHGRNILDPGKQVSSRTCGCWETPSDRFHVFFLWLLSSNQPPYTLLWSIMHAVLWYAALGESTNLPLTIQLPEPRTKLKNMPADFWRTHNQGTEWQ